MRAALALSMLAALSLPAAAEQLITQVSTDEVAITSSFQGETLTLFGSIEADPGATQQVLAGPYHVVVTVTGPLQKRVARRKSSVYGIWLNTGEATFDSFPSFYQVLADTRLKGITDEVTLALNKIPLDYQPDHPDGAGWWDATVFGNELVRLMQVKGQFRVNEQGVIFRSDTFYYAQVSLPSDAPPGPYIAKTYLFKDGKIIATRTDGFTVRKTGFELFLGNAAHAQPLLYGLVAVILALFTGWLGGVVFKR